MTSAHRRPLPREFFLRPAATVARDLLGRWLERRGEGGPRILRIVETEAYLGSEDRASHSWNRRRTARNASMYLAGGHAYVYFVYGMHFCLNVVTGRAGEGEAVLLRAGAPVAGEEAMARARRLALRPRRADLLAGGPARLCQALEVDRRCDGMPLWRRSGALAVCEGEALAEAEVIVGPRVGIDYAGAARDWPLRFARRDDPHVSRPRPDAGRHRQPSPGD